MKYKLIQKFYHGDFTRPSVETEILENENLALFSISWGNREGGRGAHQVFKEYFNSSMSDPESTSPFARLPGLTSVANTLRISTMLANDLIYQKFNRTKYVAGCELLALSLNNSELTWVQVGQPHILLFREKKLHFVEAGTDLGFQFKNPTPLPEKLLGINQAIDLETHSMVIQPDDSLILLARQSIPQKFFLQNFNLKNEETFCQNLFDLAADEDSKIPFWLALLQFHKF